MGADDVGGLFDEVCALAREGHALLAPDSRYEVVVEPSLSTLVYRYVPASGAHADPEAVDRANLHAREAGTKVDGRRYLKFTLLNLKTAADIAAVLDLIAGHAEQYLGENLVHA